MFWGELGREVKWNGGGKGTVDGANPANQLIGSLSHYSQGFILPRWCRISAINSHTIFD